MESITTYRMTPEGIEKLLGQLRNALLVGPVAGVTAMAAVAFFLWQNESSFEPFFLAPLVVVPVAAFFQFRRFARQQERAWESYELAIGPDLVLRRQTGYRDIRVPRTEIRGIVEHRRGGMTVYGRQVTISIYIPEGIERYEEIRSVLSQWTGPVAASTQRMYYFLATGAVLVSLLAHFGKEWVTDPNVRLLAHLASAAAFVWMFFELRRSPLIEERAKRYWWVLLLWALADLYSAFEIIESWPTFPGSMQ